jgi:hypothetical protein
MTDLETERRHAILKTPSFWTKLEFEMSGWLAQSPNSDYRKYWIDGFEPDSIENTRSGAVVFGLVWMAIGSRSQEKFHFSLSIPQVLLYRLQLVHQITSVLIDEPSRRIEITLDRSKSNHQPRPNKSVEATG